jgi:methylphosphotriester-DNA--protein-cysteine methyltransferase
MGKMPDIEECDGLASVGIDSRRPVFHRCCRPVCFVRPAKAANVTFSPSNAAAEAAGFRSERLLDRISASTTDPSIRYAMRINF